MTNVIPTMVSQTQTESVDGNMSWKEFDRICESNTQHLCES